MKASLKGGTRVVRFPSAILMAIGAAMVAPDDASAGWDPPSHVVLGDPTSDASAVTLPEAFAGIAPDAGVCGSRSDSSAALASWTEPTRAAEDADPVTPEADDAESGDSGITPVDEAVTSGAGPESEPEPMRVATASPVDRMPPASLDRPLPPEAISPESDPIAYAKAALAASKARFAQVRDYTCTFIKRERIDGRLSDYHVMTMKARTNPHSVYFKFRQPKAGREAIYVQGRNQGKAIVHDVGIGRLLAGTVHLDPLSRRAMEGNRHPITAAGIGFLIDSLTEGWHREMNPRDSVVTIRQNVLVNKRPSTLIICTHPEPNPAFVFHEVRLYIDRELGLPIRFESYDWPRRAGEAPPLVEEYIYADLQLNVGLTDLDFDPSNKAYSFGRF